MRRPRLFVVGLHLRYPLSSFQVLPYLDRINSSNDQSLYFFNIYSSNFLVTWSREARLTKFPMVYHFFHFSRNNNGFIHLTYSLSLHRLMKPKLIGVPGERSCGRCGGAACLINFSWSATFKSRRFYFSQLELIKLLEFAPFFVPHRRSARSERTP